MGKSYAETYVFASRTRNCLVNLRNFVDFEVFRSDFEWFGSMQIGENRGFVGLAVPGGFGS